MPLTNKLLVLSGITVIVIIIYSATIGRKKLCLTEAEIFLARLPYTFDGFKIVLFSDLHLGFFCSPKDLLSLAVIVNSQNPDAIFFAGDLTDKRVGKYKFEEAAEALKRFKAAYGKYAVFGNHDYHTGVLKVKKTLESGGFLVLSNQSATLTKNGQKIQVIGLDDAIRGKVNIKRALSFREPELCSILLVHEPDIAEVTSRYNIDLQLSGHSHGGQVRLPLIGPLKTTQLARKFVYGLYNLGKMQLYTTRGVGVTILPIRFFCRPEIVIITLKSL